MTLVWAVILVLIGLGFTLAEVFFPSLGAFALLAGTSIILADFMAFGVSHTVGWIFIGVQVVLVPVVIRGAFKILPKTRFGKTMMLAGPVTEPGPGFPSLSHLVDNQGEALSDLRPSGTARFGDERVSVVAQGGLIPEGTPVVVVSVEGTEIKVRAAPDADAPSHP